VRRGVLAGVAILVVAGLVVSLATGLARTAWTAGLYRAGLLVDGGASTVPPGMFSQTPTAPSVAPATLKPVLGTVDDEPDPKAATLRKLLAHVPGGNVGTIAYEVADALTGTVITGQRAGTGMMPASTLKILTTTALLSELGPDATFDTSVVEESAATSVGASASASPTTTSATKSRIVIIGGGDPYLETTTDASAYPQRASVDELAAAAAKALKKAGRTSVTVDWDASWFTGTGWNPAWPSNYRDVVSTTSSLWVDEGKLPSGARSTQPAHDAAAAFAKALTKHGVKATVGKSDPGFAASKAGQSATELATVHSMPLSEIVNYVLLHSDNDGAEVLFRQLGRAVGGNGSIGSAQKALHTVLSRLGLWDAAIKVDDGSGLSRGDRVPPATLVKAVDLAMSEAHPELRPVILGLPLAGVDGSLAGRFFSSGTSAALGEVHAKTGTLTGTHALAGYVLTKQGSLVSFAFVVNNAGNGYDARVWLDRATAALASCGC